MRALKTLVITLGALIVIGLSVVVVTLVQRPTGDEPVFGVSGLENAARRIAFGDVRIDLPPGASILKTKIAGDRLIVHLSPSGGDFTGPAGPGLDGTDRVALVVWTSEQ